MSNEEKKILLAVGRVEGEVRAMRREVGGVHKQLVLQRQALVDHGKAIAALPCEHRRRQISELYEAVGQVKEDTGVFAIATAEKRGKKKFLLRLGKIVGGVMVSAAAGAAIWQVILQIVRS